MARPNAIPNTHLRDASRWTLAGKDLPGSVSAPEQRSKKAPCGLRAFAAEPQAHWRGLSCGQIRAASRRLGVWPGINTHDHTGQGPARLR